VIGFSSTTVFPNVFDLERVEILRGPQEPCSAPDRRAAPSGSSPRSPASPTTRLHPGELGFTEHGDPSFEAGAAVGGPIVEDKIGFRASAWYRRDGGYTNRVERFGGALIAKDDDWQNSYNARVALTFQPSIAC